MATRALFAKGARSAEGGARAGPFISEFPGWRPHNRSGTCDACGAAGGGFMCLPNDKKLCAVRCRVEGIYKPDWISSESRTHRAPRRSLGKR